MLLLVLPPVIYSSAVAMSWREFRFNLRPISLLAVGCVVFTTVADRRGLALAAGLPWPVGFVLGAIVSPPDAVAPLSIARRMQLPRRILVILEGEGLANDATALILYRFAVGAVSAGVFSFSQAAGSFAAIVVGEILWGIGVGWLMLRLRRWVDDPRIEITALGADPVPGLLAAGASRRLGRARHRDRRALHQLERSAADQRRDAPAGHLLLGFLIYLDRGHGVPHHRLAGAHARSSASANIRCPRLAMSAAVVSAWS